MSSHPNRSRRTPSAARNPSPAEVLAARQAAGLSQAAAAALIHAGVRSWEEWEGTGGARPRPMHPAFWELFRLKIAGARL